uniref:helix-turn-helix domain-containing protein n=1 Tax=Shewanella gaetbuli TaxID=220752 RepID=UPI003B5BF423
MTDDEKLLKGEIVTDRIEMNIVKEGEFGWFSTSKRPLLDADGNIIGTYGITRLYQKSAQALSPFQSIQLPIDFIRKNFHQQISLEQLANLAHVSISALERRFKKCLSKTPTRFIKEVRLENARLLLMEKDLPISEVAYQVGFSDHSYFTKEFRNFFGVHPTKLREQIKIDVEEFES